MNWQGDDRAPYARIYDANGVEHAHVVKLDTITGELERYVPTADGAVVVDPLDPEKLRTERIVIPAPVKVVSV